MNGERTQDQILRDVLRLLRRQRGLIIASLLIAAAAGAVYSILKTPVYEASAQLQVNEPSKAGDLLRDPALRFNGPAGATAASQIATSNLVVRGVAQRLDGALSESAIRDSVRTTVDPENNLVTVKGRADDADLAAALANGVARQTKITATRAERRAFRRAARNLQRTVRGQHRGSAARRVNVRRMSQLQSLASIATPVAISKTALPPGSPVSPRPLRDILLALLLGLILGILAAFLRDSLDRRLTEARDVGHELQLPIMGYVDAAALAGIGSTSNGAERGFDPGIEPFRIIRSNVGFMTQERGLRTVAVTSPVAEEGKSTVATGLAIATALAGHRVLLLECDLRRPGLAERMRLKGEPGLTDWIAGAGELAEVAQPTPIQREIEPDQGTAQAGSPVGSAGLHTVVAGTWSPRPAELLGSERFRGYLGEAAAAYDLVVLDCAPLLPVGDALQVLPLVDTVLVCIRLDQTTRDQALAARVTLQRLPARPMGVVVTGVRPGREGYPYGYYSPRSGDPGGRASPGYRAQGSGLSL